jgi:hypothetical protein
MLKLLQDREDVDSLDFLSAVVTSPEVELSVRVPAAIALAAYQHAKCTTKHISKTIELPPPRDIGEAKEQIAQIIGLVRIRYIGVDEGDMLINQLKTYIEAQQGLDHEERLQRLEAGWRESPPVIDVTTEGGLPTMPGCEGVRMPPRQISQPAAVRPKGVERNPWTPKGEDGS